MDSTDARKQDVSAVSKLLLVQGIHQLGTADWDAISELINEHPLHAERIGEFTPIRCSELYQELSRDSEVDPDEIYPPQAPVLLGLAKKYYLQLVVKIREDMLYFEDQYRIKLGEIEEIESGARDEEFIAPRYDLSSLGGLPPLPDFDEAIATRRNSRSGRDRGRNWAEEEEEEEDEEDDDEEEVKMEVDDVYVD